MLFPDFQAGFSIGSLFLGKSLLGIVSKKVPEAGGCDCVGSSAPSSCQGGPGVELDLFSQDRFYGPWKIPAGFCRRGWRRARGSHLQESLPRIFPSTEHQLWNIKGRIWLFNELVWGQSFLSLHWSSAVSFLCHRVNSGPGSKSLFILYFVEKVFKCCPETAFSEDRGHI